MKSWGMWIQKDNKVIDTDSVTPDIIITNPDYVYEVNTNDGKSKMAGIKEIEITGLKLDCSPDSAEYDNNDKLIKMQLWFDMVIHEVTKYSYKELLERWDISFEEAELVEKLIEEKLGVKLFG